MYRLSNESRLISFFLFSFSWRLLCFERLSFPLNFIFSFDLRSNFFLRPISLLSALLLLSFIFRIVIFLFSLNSLSLSFFILFSSSFISFICSFVDCFLGFFAPFISNSFDVGRNFFCSIPLTISVSAMNRISLSSKFFI